MKGGDLAAAVAEEVIHIRCIDQLIVKMFGSKYKFLKSRPGDRFGSIISNNNAKKILGFSAKINIKNYIKDLVSRS